MLSYEEAVEMNEGESNFIAVSGIWI